MDYYLISVSSAILPIILLCFVAFCLPDKDKKKSNDSIAVRDDNTNATRDNDTNAVRDDNTNAARDNDTNEIYISVSLDSSIDSEVLGETV